MKHRKKPYIIRASFNTLQAAIYLERETPNLVAKVIWSRRPLSAFDNKISFVNGPYMSDVLQNVHPMSAAIENAKIFRLLDEEP